VVVANDFVLSSIFHILLVVVWWLDLPDVYITPAVQTLHPGEHLMMRCIEVDGQPVLFKWSKVDGTLSSAVHTDSSGVLEVASVTARDAGRYQCHATNQAGYSDAFAEIILTGTCYVSDDVFRY